jgi:hypothetical protein
MSLRLQPLAAAAAVLLATAAPAMAHIQTWTGSFVPEGSGGRTGSGTLLLEYDHDINTLAITATFAGLSGNTTVAHIHCCAGFFPATAGVALAGGPGGTLINFPAGVRAATYSQNFNLGDPTVYSTTFRNNNGGTANGARDALLAAFDSKNAYFNIHTTTFGGGEIRAQVVPEPGTWALMALGLAGVGMWARRRQQTH